MRMEKARKILREHFPDKAIEVSRRCWWYECSKKNESRYEVYVEGEGLSDTIYERGPKLGELVQKVISMKRRK